MNEEGKVERTYWKDCEAMYEPRDFLVLKIGSRKSFYVLRTNPDVDIDVFVSRR